MDENDRFWSRVGPPNERGCRLWLGRVQAGPAGGYGHFDLPRDGGAPRVVAAHRHAWVLRHGPIPDGLCVLHSCDVRLCLEDSHHFLGTKADNAHDMIAKGRDFRPLGEQHGNAKLTDVKVQMIRFLAQNTSLSQFEIADLLSVHRVTTNKVIRGDVWKHVAPIELVAA